MSDKVEKLYAKLKDKYKKLPDFKRLDSEFEITSIKDEYVNERYFSRLVRRRIYEKFYSFNVSLINIINPQSPSIIIAHESKFLTDEDRANILRIVKNLMEFERQHIVLEIDYDESKDVEFIVFCFDAWQKMKPPIKIITEKLRDSWSKEESFKAEDYFG
jgi:hypothetical protein